jgi:hypothetical protein
MTEDTEQSFLDLCEFDQIKVNGQPILHNLSKWRLTVSGAKIKDNQIQLEIGVPYAEMDLVAENVPDDPQFFGKNTTRLQISSRAGHQDSLMSYIASRTITVFVSVGTQYLLFDTPYFYPHNWYFGSNKDYLYKKIAHSANFMNYFIEGYKKCFQTNPPMIYIKEARETRNHYEIDLILKEYMTITYLKTDKSTATLHFHLLIDIDKKNTPDKVRSSKKFCKRTLRFPREIRTGVVYFTFTANMT